VELGVVVVDSDREAHPLDRQLELHWAGGLRLIRLACYDRIDDGVRGQRLGAQKDTLPLLLPGPHQHRPSIDVQQAAEGPRPSRGRGVASAAAGQLERPGRAHLDRQRLDAGSS